DGATSATHLSPPALTPVARDDAASVAGAAGPLILGPTGRQTLSPCADRQRRFKRVLWSAAGHSTRKFERGAGVARAPDWGASITLVPFLAPGVATVVVAVPLPETRLVVVHELHAGHPLGALPEVQVRNQQPYRSAVFDRQRRAVELPHEPRLAAG